VPVVEQDIKDQPAMEPILLSLHLGALRVFLFNMGDHINLAGELKSLVCCTVKLSIIIPVFILILCCLGNSPILDEGICLLDLGFHATFNTMLGLLRKQRQTGFSLLPSKPEKFNH
jgi:hypothetical protein